MNERVGGHSRTLLGLGLLIAVLVALALSAGSASAKTTANTTAHWEITLPDSWVEKKDNNGSTFSENSNGAPPTIVVASEANSTAKDTDAYILAGAQQVCDQVKNSLGGTYATAPHTFTGLSRKAAECIIDISIAGIVDLRARYIFFASDGLDRVYFVGLTDDKSHFATSEPIFNAGLSSFKITGEPAVAGDMMGGGMMMYAIIAVVVIVVILVAVMMMKKKKGGAAPPDQPPAQPPASPPAK